MRPRHGETRTGRISSISAVNQTRIVQSCSQNTADEDAKRQKCVWCPLPQPNGPTWQESCSKQKGMKPFFFYNAARDTALFSGVNRLATCRTKCWCQEAAVRSLCTLSSPASLNKVCDICDIRVQLHALTHNRVCTRTACVNRYMTRGRIVHSHPSCATAFSTIAWDDLEDCASVVRRESCPLGSQPQVRKETTKRNVRFLNT